MEELKGCGGRDGLRGNVGHPDPAGCVPRKERGSVLDKAKSIINGARQDQYGNPEDSFKTIADFWSVYIRHRHTEGTGFWPIEKEDVALMMALMKIAREMHGAGKEDNMIDAAGYIGLAADMANYSKKENNND